LIWIVYERVEKVSGFNERDTRVPSRQDTGVQTNTDGGVVAGEERRGGCK